MIESILFVVFLAVLALFLWSRRENIKVQKVVFPLLYIVLYRTKLGLKSMNSIALRFPRLTKWFGFAGIVFGFIGMAFISVMLVQNTVALITGSSGASGVQLVLPIEKKGFFYVPPIYWIVSIFLIAVVHEFAHGVLSRRWKVNVKSSGFAFVSIFVPVIPAAFVEPDEKKLDKKETSAQLSVFAAGPFANIVSAFVSLVVLLFVVSPLTAGLFNPLGVEIVEVSDDSPASRGGILKGDIINVINDQPIKKSDDFVTLLNAQKPGDRLVVSTSNGVRVVTLGPHPDDKEKPYIGIKSSQFIVPKESVSGILGSRLPFLVVSFGELFYWLFVLNLGIGLFNLLPVGPLDGGKMFHTAVLHFSEARARKVSHAVSLFFVAVLVLNLFAGFFV